MTAGLPGAGIGGLFYLASTLLLPVRSAWRRLSGQSDPVPSRHQFHSVAIALGIIGGLWVTGWLLGFVVPDEMAAVAASGTSLAGTTRMVMPVATFAVGVGTLVAVLAAVEVARYVVLRSGSFIGSDGEGRSL
jgi:hypothetical protein